MGVLHAEHCGESKLSKWMDYDAAACAICDSEARLQAEQTSGHSQSCVDERIHGAHPPEPNGTNQINQQNNHQLVFKSLRGSPEQQRQLALIHLRNFQM